MNLFGWLEIKIVLENLMPKILVVGSASLDTLIINDQPVPSAGGAGMYTAMSAHRAGANVTMFGLRPNPVPEVLAPMEVRLEEWLGPNVAPDQMPHFTIRHQGDKAEYLDFKIGAESLMDPDFLPDDLSSFDGIHVIPFGRLEVQRRFCSPVVTQRQIFLGRDFSG